MNDYHALIYDSHYLKDFMDFTVFNFYKTQ